MGGLSSLHKEWVFQAPNTPPNTFYTLVSQACESETAKS